MRKYVAGEHVACLTRTSLATLPVFLVPPTSILSLKQSLPKIRAQPLARCLATAATDAPLHYDGHVKAIGKARYARRAMTAILHSETATSQNIWPCLLEPYLPQHLQRQKQREVDAALADIEKAVPIRDLHIWLAEARRIKDSKGDLLTYLTVNEDRQDAVVWLVEAMLKEHANDPETRSTLFELPTVSEEELPSLDDVTRSATMSAEMLDVRRSLKLDLDTLTDPIDRPASHVCLGQIWRSVGSMILQAAEHKPASAESRSIMVCVHRILAHLHHVGAVPSSIYNQTQAQDPSVLQRPPTLYLWSLRIMGDLSDASLNSINPVPAPTENEPFSLHDASSTSGAGLSQVARGSLAPEVEPQIWLDFVLWCCVEGGWITEAAEIVQEMWARSVEGQQYSVIDWNTLRQQTAPKLPWTTRIKLAINGSRMREYAGGASFGSYDERAYSLKPPERTVSSEVIAAIVDALVNTASPRPNISGYKPSIVESKISVCKILLDRQRLALEFCSWDSIILRMFESLSSDPNVPQTFLEKILSWSPSFLQEPDSANSAYKSSSMAQTYIADPSAVTPGLLHQLLMNFALVGDFHAALRIFQRLQYTVDVNRRISLDSFHTMVSSIFQRDEDEVSIRSTVQPEVPGLNPQLPGFVLAPFLDLITDVKDLDLGRWLLYSDDVDGCIIPQSMYSDPVVQPALISFASAAGDERLLNNVTERLEAPLPEGVLRALLHHQIRSAEWGGVREILELFRDVDELTWDATDVMALAGAALRLEKVPSDVDTLSPGVLLQRLMRGEYNKALDPSQRREFSQPRVLNQLARIIASVPSELSRQLSPFYPVRYSRLSAGSTIPTRAFNDFLECTVELFGILEGKRLCDQWCWSREEASLWEGLLDTEAKPFVEPNVQTFYIFFRLISQSRRQSDDVGQNSQKPRDEPLANADGRTKFPNHQNEMEHSVIEWAVGGCLRLGLQRKRIRQDFPILKITP
ncbi:MAG: hypothetical protein Q9166_007831 [cf. Caloplaca sp. 2 TL-2023]